MLTGGMLAVALGANLLAPGNPWRSVAPPLQAPSSAFWLGTDDLGRDMWTLVAHGARVSLTVGLVTAFMAAVIGCLVGGIAGYFGRRVDDVLMRVIELFQVVPRFFLAVVVTALFGANISGIILLLGLTYWPGPARLVRAQVLSLRERDFILAARAVGVPTHGILRRHILPNTLSVLVVSAALQVGSAIITEASLSFLGLGDRNVVSWGYLLNNAQPFLRVAWWMSAWPGLALALTVIGVNLLGDSLNQLWGRRRLHR